MVGLFDLPHKVLPRPLGRLLPVQFFGSAASHGGCGRRVVTLIKKSICHILLEMAMERERDSFGSHLVIKAIEHLQLRENFPGPKMKDTKFIPTSFLSMRKVSGTMVFGPIFGQFFFSQNFRRQKN